MFLDSKGNQEGGRGEEEEKKRSSRRGEERKKKEDGGRGANLKIAKYVCKSMCKLYILQGLVVIKHRGPGEMAQQLKAFVPVMNNVD